MEYLRFCSFTLLWTLAASHVDIPGPLSDEFIESINRGQSYWRAERTFPVGTTLDDIKRLLGARRSDTTGLQWKTHDPELIASLPDSFDPRTKWPNCPTLDYIRDQGNCGSCWVFGSVEAMTDRYCIHSNGTKEFYFSAEDVLTCSSCGSCNGGEPQCVYNKWQKDGIVSGGPYNSSQGCRPYEIPPCKIHKQGVPCPPPFGPTPDCVQSCIKPYGSTYEKDLRKCKHYYAFEGEDDIKAELYANGPVTTGMDVYEDFVTYKSGIYKHTKGKFLGGHAIKMLGWGEERGVKYWLLANSWNVEWGERGFFRILRGGENECGIEDQALGGLPLYP